MNEKDIASMRAIELGRALVGLGCEKDAADAFALALDDAASPPEEVMEAAMGLLQCGGDYHAAYDALLRLYGGGAEAVPPALRADALAVLREAFYLPNEDDLRRRYQENRALLERYPYLFRRDFPDFEDLPLRFFPYDDGVYCPFDGARFLPRIQPDFERISRNFFHDLEKPVLATDVYSQYELSYLRDNVRASEDVGRENHIYLHYSDWHTFCSWMQVLRFRPLLEEEKLVFFIGEEVARYPIDFAAEYGIDYSRCPLKPVRVREVTRLIWHTQLSTHNGGDFFNEIFDSHPNLICIPSVMFSNIQEMVRQVRTLLEQADNPAQARYSFRHWEDPGLGEELYRMESPTDKDLLVALYLGQTEWNRFRDRASRIAPALFFQPHFPNMAYHFVMAEGADAVLASQRIDEIHQSSLLSGFRYIKTFTPLRRFTASFGGSMRFMLTLSNDAQHRDTIPELRADTILYQVMNRSFMADPADRLFRDGVIVRLEDGKLNPAATFTRLASFLDIPYTESMTWCSTRGERDRNPSGDPLYAVGFSLASLHRDDSRYMNESEQAFIEFAFRDAYAFYGYSFQHYDGQPMDRRRMEALLDGFATQDRILREDWEIMEEQSFSFLIGKEEYQVTPETPQEERERLWAAHLDEIHRDRQIIGLALLLPLRFVSPQGRPLRMIPLLEPDPALLDRPVYR